MSAEDKASRSHHRLRRDIFPLITLGTLGLLIESACSTPPALTPTTEPRKPFVPTEVKPTLTPPPTATAAATPTAKLAESKFVKVWETKVNPSGLGNVDPHDSKPPAYLWNGKQLYINSLNGSVMEVDIRNGRDINWEWKNRGFCLGVDQGLLYLAHYNGLRLEVFDTNSKFFKWDYQLRREFLNTAAAMAVYTPKDIRWPIIQGDLLTIFQFERGFYAVNPNKTLNIENKGYVVASSQDRILFTSELAKWGSRSWGLYGASNKKYLWTHEPDYKRPTYGAADSDVFIVSTPVKVNPGQPYLDGPYEVQARSMVTGTPIWPNPKGTENYTGSALVSKHLVMVGGRYQIPNSSWLFNKQNGDEVGKFTSNQEKDQFRFAWAEDWFLASNEQQGVTAYLKGSERWRNPNIGPINSLVKATTDQLILTRDEGQGVMWAVDPQNGQKLWPEVNFNQPITSKVLVGEMLVVATGNEKTGSFSSINTKDGRKGELDLGLTEPMHHLTAVGTSALLGQSGNRLIALKLV